MKVTFAAPALPKSGALVLAVGEGVGLDGLGAEADAAAGGALSRAMAAARFDGKARTVVEILAPAGLDAERVLLAGAGAEPGERAAEDLAGTVCAALAKSGSRTATLIWPRSDLAAAAGLGAALAAYRFDKYRTVRENEKDKPTLAEFTVATADAAAAERAYADAAKVAEGVAFARNFVSEPGNVLYPTSYADSLAPLGELGVEVEVFDRSALEDLGMGALLGVAQGSAREARVVVMHWRGGSKEAPLALVGKGVTFDTGGISIKPASGMEAMKWDMGGSAAVAGAMKALAGRKARANVVGIVGLVENMPSAPAQRPGDVVTSYSGRTIEVINTDAEGRLVLADLLAYVIARCTPSAAIDLATLTGAMVVSLGHEYAGMFSNDDTLAGNLYSAGLAVDEKVWRLPLGDAYDKLIRSDIADMKNVGPRGAGAISAAQFLKRFVGETPWAHLDIAGMAWTDEARPTVPKGATGFGVRLLDRLVRDAYEG